MSPDSKSKGAPRVAIVAPTTGRARSASSLLAKRLTDCNARSFSLADFLAAPGSRAIVLCPGGESLEEDLAFLREVHERVLWKLPDRIVHAAIAGLLGELPDPGRLAGARSSGKGAVLLLEGRVGWRRARAALHSDARLWVVEGAGQVRLSRGRLAELARSGVRWAVLRPVPVLALAATARLARSRPRWKRLLPAKTPVWMIEDVKRKT